MTDEIKAVYDRIVINSKEVVFYNRNVVVRAVPAIWDKERGDTLTLTDLDGVLTFRSER